jgi:2-C-methyl-D-erythritol 4-phosphate cytidylyltransferase/2-C-methyl-D-erythritol 2,4-cyclodiphosphate synthase
LLAAGAGERLGSSMPKAFVRIDDVPMFLRSLAAMAATVDAVVLVAPNGYEEHAMFVVAEAALARPVTVVTGGATRRESVALALASVGDDAEIVVVHDAARPFANVAHFRAVIDAARETGAAICASPVRDTLKRARDGDVVETVERAGLWGAETPQAFRAALLRDAHARAASDGFDGTDDASLVERIGARVRIVGDVPGPANVKVTTQADLELIAPFAAATRGIGFDAHRLVPGRRLVVGGVEIPYERGLDGHSDADVLCHAVADAILGAGALGDLGTHFPSGDERWRDAAGTELLARAHAELLARDREVAFVDATVIMQAPPLSKFRDEMRAAIGHALHLDPAFVSVKFTTTDGLGVAGSGEGAAAQAVVHVVPVTPS